MYPFSLGMFRAMHAHGARTVQVMQFTERVMEAQRNAIVELKTMRVHRALSAPTAICAVLVQKNSESRWRR